MAGICLDALNPVGHPTARRLHSLRTTSVRLEIRNDPTYTSYVNSLGYGSIQNYALIGPSTDAIQPPLESLYFPPNVFIIGNEPDGVGESSWSMPTDNYIAIWNSLALPLKQRFPYTKLCAAGMVGTPHYLSLCWPDLDIKPDIVNKHYPNNEDELKEYKEIFNRPVIVGEWCWKTATQDEMTDWVAMLAANTLEHFWFCWSDGMVDGMGLVNKTDHPTVAYRRYKKAIESLGGI